VGAVGEVELPLGTWQCADEKMSGTATGRCISNRTKSFPRRMNKAGSEAPVIASERDQKEGNQIVVSPEGERAEHAGISG
jgi:hypothetical protein